MRENSKSIIVLSMNTLAFMVCFAVWMMNGVLITFLVENQLYAWDKAQMGVLIGIPVLTGSLVRLPVGILTDKYGGRIVYTLLMLIAGIATALMSFADSYVGFICASLGFGISGASFAVGIAYTSVWFRRERQGFALGIFGAGNAGAAITSIFAPQILRFLTDNGENLSNWRMFPRIYAVALFIMAIVFYALTFTKITENNRYPSFLSRLRPLKEVRVWRFGLYYFFVFGGFVALAQWLIPYYVNVYTMSIATAGLMASVFSLPSGVIRALGGLLSDHYGARKIMYWVFGSSLLCCILLIVPQMSIRSPGSGIMALRGGTITTITPEAIYIDDTPYFYKADTTHELRDIAKDSNEMLVFPKAYFWHEPVVSVGQKVNKRELLARGITHIYFQANVWIFTFLVFVLGIMMGIGKAAVYKHIPEYFPKEVGVVGGLVGVIGGLGGFFCPIIFGSLLKATGIWTTSWMFFVVLIAISLWWMHIVIQKMMREKAPDLMHRIDSYRVKQEDATDEALSYESISQLEPRR